MATPKEQHDARPNARNIGLAHRRALPADATPPEGVRALTLQDLEPADASGDPPHAAPREPAGHS
ncbi:hypothetical protein [Roseisolibacter agri]|uniref:Uncharacterized protein n=1 Tax=Roseisolibacter agri TaxID=2014610 RepID=A0AA37VBN0_9BACT|nr:hypothetical protein [Roseisolibacter agri]GLC26638.1 hypothetical protein rosag_31510 [Roseisolibacter agri]